MEEFRQAIMYLSQYTQHARQPTNPVDTPPNGLELLHLVVKLMKMPKNVLMIPLVH